MESWPTQKVQIRQEQDLGLSPNDFPLDCPDDEILSDILSVSLDHDRILRDIRTEGYGTSTSSGNSRSTYNVTVYHRGLDEDVEKEF